MWWWVAGYAAVLAATLAAAVWFPEQVGRVVLSKPMRPFRVAWDRMKCGIGQWMGLDR